ncbi:hypothetical protein MACH05_25710 [Qipengyuania nanhaisediminis]
MRALLAVIKRGDKLHVLAQIGKVLLELCCHVRIEHRPSPQGWRYWENRTPPIVPARVGPGTSCGGVQGLPALPDPGPLLAQAGFETRRGGEGESAAFL